MEFKYPYSLNMNINIIYSTCTVAKVAIEIIVAILLANFTA